MAIIDAILSGVIAALVVSTIVDDVRTAALAGVVAGVVVLVLLSAFLAGRWRTAIRSFGVRFTSDRPFEATHTASQSEAGPKDDPGPS